MGQVCQKHNQFYETTCRWCEPAAGVNAVWIDAPQRTFAEAIEGRILAMEHSRETLRDLIASIDPDLSESPLDRHGGCE